MSAVPGLFSKTGYDGIYAGALPDGSAFASRSTTVTSGRSCPWRQLCSSG